MGLSDFKSSNPAFTSYFWDGENKSSSKMTISGIFIKSLTSILIIAFVTFCIWRLHADGYDVTWYSLGGIITSIILSVAISYKNHWAPVIVPLYAIAQGCFLGAFSAFIKDKFPDMPYQAIGVTIVTFFVMLILYQTRIIKVTQKLRSVIITASITIGVVYLISWILAFFDIKTFIWGTSWLAIIFTAVSAIVASFALLLDFDYIEKHKNTAEKSKEWLATWGLLVTLVWLYIEVLRLMQKLAIRF